MIGGILILDVLALFAFAAFQPKVELQLGPPLDPLNRLSTPIILFNRSIMPIYDISMSCTGPGIIMEPDGKMVFPAVSRLNGTKRHTGLSLGQSFAAGDLCRAPQVQHPTSFEVVVRVDFKPLFFALVHREFKVRCSAPGPLIVLR